MSDVSAVVLTIGEESLPQALASLERQTLPPAAVILIEGVSPFSAALNEGAARVMTPFFLQVDADMVLDADCVETLRACMEEGVGAAVGHLRDDLAGRTVGVRMLRTECFATGGFPDSLSPDTDFFDRIAQEGWRRVFALKFADGDLQHEHVLGTHAPSRDFHYTFQKYLREGARGRSRRRGSAMRAKLARLQGSRADMATIAVIALAHGLFLESDRDLLAPGDRSGDSEFLEGFLDSKGRAGFALALRFRQLLALCACLRRLPRLGSAERSLRQTTGFAAQRRSVLPQRIERRQLRVAFARAFELGAQLRRRQAGGVLPDWLRRLGSDADWVVWACVVGLCHGIFATGDEPNAAEIAFAELAVLLPR